MSEGREYNPTIEEIREHGENKTTERLDREKRRKSKRNKALLAVAGLATTAAIGFGTKEVIENKPNLPDNRFTPEASIPEGQKEAVAGINSQNKQEEAEASLDKITEFEATVEKKQFEEALNPQENNVSNSTDGFEPKGD